MRSHRLAVVISAVFVGMPAMADTMRCGTQVIDDESHQRDVLEHCGEPTEKRGSAWYYERGTTQFGVTVHFQPDGEVERIEEDT